uniref:Transmembrane protein 53 n=1 Tax=Scylla olivacea TaxID=85551 RepID=A0A0N7Z9X1_SCYOL
MAAGDEGKRASSPPHLPFLLLLLLLQEGTRPRQGWKTTNGDKEPVVFLLGWLGAQDQHLAKYCTIYNQRGCITIPYTSPSSYVFFRPAVKLMPIARKLLSLLRDMSLDDHPVFFHMFSNNGSVLYYYLTQAMAEPAAPRITVKGCVFDSTPAPRRIISGVRAMYEVTPGSVWMKLCG